MRYFIFPATIALSLISTNGFSTEQDLILSESDFLAENPITVTSATRLKQEPRNVPASVTIINRKMIEASSAVTIVELLRLVPGFQVGSRFGNESTVTYHGLSSEHNTRLHILINGRSVYDPIFGGALWYAIPVTMDEIESIEVVRGPNAASYGANSFSGVVNIKTFNADAFSGTQVSYMHGDERNANRYQLIHSDNKDKTRYRISLQHESNDGFADSLLDRIPEFSHYDDGTHTQLNTQIEHHAENGISHFFEFGIKDLSLGAGYENTAYFGIPASDKDVFSFYENYIWLKQSSLLEKHKIQISHTFLDQDYYEITADGDHKDGHLDPPGLPAPLDGDHHIYSYRDFQDHRVDLEYEHSLIHTPLLQTVWGGGLRYDYGESKGYFGDESFDRYSARLFGHVEWKATDEFIFNTGGLLEYYEDIGTYFSPRIGMNFHLNKNHTLRTNWSQAYRVPALYDEYASQYNYDVFDDSVHDWIAIGNPDLDPEKIKSIELGYFGRLFNDHLHIDLRLSKEEITDVIDQRKTLNGKRSADIVRWRFLNYGEIDIDSAELELSYHPSKKTLFKAYGSYANANGDRAHIVNNTSNTPYYIADNAYRFVPLVSTGVLASHELPEKLILSAQYNFVEEYTTSGNGDDLEALETFDLKVVKKLDIGQNPIELSATIKNVFDNEYWDFDEDNYVGRETYVQIKMDLK